MSDLLKRLDEAHKDQPVWLSDLWALCGESAERIRELEHALELLLDEIGKVGFHDEWDSYPQAAAALAKARGDA